MTNLVQETGAGITGANTYVLVADADAYFVQTNNTIWANLDPAAQKPAYLVAAVRYMQQMYRRRWQGLRYVTTQTLDWPRWNVMQFDVGGGYGPYPFYYQPTVIPQEIKDAQCELAVRVANGDLYPDITRMETSVAVGSLKVTYDNTKPANTVFAAVELLLAPFFVSAGISSQVER
jgi:hypothetical protein